jgi:hypothetical protein
MGGHWCTAGYERTQDRKVLFTKAGAEYLIISQVTADVDTPLADLAAAASKYQMMFKGPLVRGETTPDRYTHVPDVCVVCVWLAACTQVLFSSCRCVSFLIPAGMCT